MPRYQYECSNFIAYIMHDGPTSNAPRSSRSIIGSTTGQPNMHGAIKGNFSHAYKYSNIRGLAISHASFLLALYIFLYNHAKLTLFQL